MGDPLQAIVNHPDFKNLPLPEAHKALLASPGYTALLKINPQEASKFLSTVYYGASPRPGKDTSVDKPPVSWYNRPLISPETVGRLPSMGAASQAESFKAANIDEEIAHWEKMRDVATVGGNVEAAQRYDQLARNLRGLVGTVSGFTSPLGAATLGVGPTLRALRAGRTVQLAMGTAPSALFTAQGLGEASKPPQTGETQADVVERVLRGAGQAALGSVGVAGTEAVEPVAKHEIGLQKIGKGTGIPYSPEAVTLSKSSGSLEPTARESINAARDLDIAKADLAEVARKTPVKATGAPGTLARVTSIVRYMNNLWEASHSGPISKYGTVPTDIVAMQKVIDPVLSDVAAQNAPTEATAASNWAQRNFSGPKTLAEADGLLREINADLLSPAAQTAYGPLMYRTKQAAAEALRSEIDATLERQGEAGVKEANLRWGALRTVARNLADSGIAEARASGQRTILQRMLHLYTYFNPISGAPPHFGIAARPGMGFTVPSKLISRGFDILAKSDLKMPVVEARPETAATPPALTALGTPEPSIKTPPMSFAERVKGLPPIKLNEPRTTPTSGVTPEPEAAAVAAPPSEFEASNKAIEQRRLVNKFVSYLQGRGSWKPTEGQQLSASEFTGVDIRKPENHMKALQAFKAKQAELTPARKAK